MVYTLHRCSGCLGRAVIFMSRQEGESEVDGAKGTGQVRKSAGQDRVCENSVVMNERKSEVTGTFSETNGHEPEVCTFQRDLMRSPLISRFIPAEKSSCEGR